MAKPTCLKGLRELLRIGVITIQSQYGHAMITGSQFENKAQIENVLLDSLNLGTKPQGQNLPDNIQQINGGHE